MDRFGTFEIQAKGISIIKLGRGVRLASSIALFVAFYLWKYQ